MKKTIFWFCIIFIIWVIIYNLLIEPKCNINKKDNISIENINDSTPDSINFWLYVDDDTIK